MNITSILKFKTSSITNFGSSECNEAYFNSLYSGDFSDPNEVKQNKILGQQIEMRSHKIAEIKRKLTTTTDVFQRQSLSQKISTIKAERDELAAELTKRNLKFAVKMANSYKYLDGADFSSILSSANIGLMKAARKYSPTAHPDVNFTSYAKHWIRQQIYRDYTNDHQVRIPIPAGMLLRKIQRTQQEFYQKMNRYPSEDELAENLNMSVKKIKENLQNADITTISLNSEIMADSEETYSNFLADEQEENQRERMMLQDDLKYVKKLIDTRLTPKERYILKERYKVGQKDADANLVILDTLAKKFGLTRERIRQIENIAIAKIQKIMEDQTYDAQKDEKLPEKALTLKYYKPIIKSDLEQKVLLHYFINELTSGDSDEVKEKIAQRLKEYKFADFKKLLEEHTQPKGREVLELLFYRKNHLNMNQIAQNLNLSIGAINNRKISALADIKRFLLQKDETNYLCLKQAIIQKIANSRSHKATSKRIARAEHKDIDIVLSKILRPIDKEYLSCKFGLKEQFPSGYRVKTNREVAQIYKTAEYKVAQSINDSLEELKEYYKKPTELSTNLTVFAEAATLGIPDAQIRARALSQIKAFDKQKIVEFFDLLLNENEKIVLTKKYNLDKYNNPKTAMVAQRKILDCLPHVENRLGITKITNNAFEKIRKYFEYGHISNSKIFINDVLSYINDESKKETIKKILLFKSDEEISKMLDEALPSHQATEIKRKYLLNPKETTNIDEFSIVQNKEMQANIEKIIEHLTKGFPSNIEILAQNIASASVNDENKQKIFEIIKNKSLEEINRDMQQILSHFEFEVMQYYFSTNQFVPSVNETPDVEKFALRVGKSNNAIYLSKRNAVAKMNRFYLRGIPTNIKLFINTLADSARNTQLGETIRNELLNTSPLRLNYILSRCLTPEEKELLTYRYSLDQILEFYKQPISLSTTGEKFGYSLSTTYNHELKAFEKIHKYIKSWDKK